MRNRHFPVTVDYDQSLEAMIKAGHYAWFWPEILTAGFLIEGSGKQDVVIDFFEGESPHHTGLVQINNLLLQMDRAGFRPAKIEELLTLGAQYPGLQMEGSPICINRIRALGSFARKGNDFWYAQLAGARWSGSTAQGWIPERILTMNYDTTLLSADEFPVVRK